MELPSSGRWWRRSAHAAPPPGLGDRVIKILRLAEEEADEIREGARQAAAAIIEQAEQDAARIRADAEAEAEARAIRAGADGADGAVGAEGEDGRR